MDSPGQRRMGTAARLWARLRATLWFLPTAIVVLSAGMAALLSDVDPGRGLGELWPRVFDARAEGTRQMLASLAGAMITVASVVLSVTIVALAQASSQYSPRVLRNFMRDLPTQLVLGTFVGCFGYCIVVLRTVRGGEDAYVPSLAAFGAMAYAFLAIALLIFFIHHVAQGIQAAFIAARIQEETEHAIDRTFPARTQRVDGQLPPAVPPTQCRVEAQGSGYVTGIDFDALMGIARATGRILVVAVQPGDFVAKGRPLLGAAGAEPLDDKASAALNSCFALGRQRTAEQDPSFGIQQLVDVTVKALSPGVNDPTTACHCIDRLGALLARVAERDDPVENLRDGDDLRVIAPAQRFEELLQVAAPIVHHSRGDPQVLARVLDAAGHVMSRCDDRRRLRAIARLGRELERALRDADSPPARHVRRRAMRLVHEAGARSAAQGQARVTASPALG